MSKRFLALGVIATASLSGCVSMPLDYGVAAAGCPAMTASAPITAERPIYIVATGMPDCRGASPVLTVGRGTPLPFGAPRPYGGPIRYGVETAPMPITAGAAPQEPVAAGAKKAKKQAMLPVLGLVEEQAWRRRLAADVAKSSGKRVLLFVHGFNSAPDEALKRADEVSAAAGFDGPVVAFLWPSQRSVAKYTWDEENERWTQPYLDTLLIELATVSDDVVLVAHSMGNRMAIDALSDLQRAHPELATHIRTVVLASPDVDREIFDRDLARVVVAPGRHVTLYASRLDRALQASWAIHGAPRAGDVNCTYRLRGGKADVTHCYPAARPGLEVVDTSEVSKGLGHTDFVQAPEGAADLCHALAGQPNPKGRVKVDGAFVLARGVVDRTGCPEGAKRLVPHPSM
ncbi:MAG: alpha/beta fold hydrolase [Sphingomonas sp.]